LYEKTFLLYVCDTLTGDPMVLGIGEGSIEIKIDKASYVPGEAITGQVILKLNQPKNAKELRIMFYGEYERRKRHSHYNSRRGRHSDVETHTERIWVQNITLDGEKAYPAGVSTYSFKIQLPQYNAQPQQAITLGPISIPLGSSDPVKRARWYLNASLNLSMSFDISKKQQIALIV
jgi:hypothetical protein